MDGIQKWSGAAPLFINKDIINKIIKLVFDKVIINVAVINKIDANLCVRKYFSVLSEEYLEFFFNSMGINLSKLASKAIQIINQEFEEIRVIIDVIKIITKRRVIGWNRIN